MKFLVIILSAGILVAFANCNSSRITTVKKVISLSGYKKLEIDSSNNDTSNGFIYIKPLNIYPANHTCTDVETFSNLIVAQTPSLDTVYIFEECSNIPDEFFDTTGRYPLVIDKDKISKKNHEKVIIFVPQNFVLPAKAKYLFTKLGIMEES